MTSHPFKTYKSEQGLEYPTMADPTGKYGCHASMTPVPLLVPTSGSSTTLLRSSRVLLLLSFVSLLLFFFPSTTLGKDELEAVQQFGILFVEPAGKRKM